MPRWERGLGGLPPSLTPHPASRFMCWGNAGIATQSDRRGRANEGVTSPWPPGSLLPWLPAGPVPCHSLTAPLLGPWLPAGRAVLLAPQRPHSAQVFNNDLPERRWNRAPSCSRALGASSSFLHLRDRDCGGRKGAVPTGLGPGLHLALPSGQGSGSVYSVLFPALSNSDLGTPNQGSCPGVNRPCWDFWQVTKASVPPVSSVVCRYHSVTKQFAWGPDAVMYVLVTCHRCRSW